MEVIYISVPTKEDRKMIIRLKKGETPNDADILQVKLPLDFINPESDVVWMDYDEWLREPIYVSGISENIPSEIKALIPKWRALAESIEKDENKTYWPVKYAYTDVWFGDGKYRIGASILSGIGKDNTSSWLYEMIQHEVKEDLYSVGAIYVKYDGMID